MEKPHDKTSKKKSMVHHDANLVSAGPTMVHHDANLVSAGPTMVHLEAPSLLRRLDPNQQWRNAQRVIINCSQDGDANPLPIHIVNVYSPSSGKRPLTTHSRQNALESLVRACGEPLLIGGDLASNENMLTQCRSAGKPVATPAQEKSVMSTQAASSASSGPTPAAMPAPALNDESSKEDKNETGIEDDNMPES